MQLEQPRVMRGPFNRALIIAAGIVAILAAASSSRALASGTDSAITAPPARLAGSSFSLDLPVLMPALSTGPQDLSRYATNEVFSEILLFDGVGIDTGFNVDIARVLDRYAPTAGAYDGLFYSASALNSPFASLASGGSLIGTTVSLADDLHFHFGLASREPGLNPYLVSPRLAVAGLGGAGLPYDTRHTNALIAGLSWNFAKWGGLGFTASQTSEHDGALGTNNSSIDTARTSALGLTAHVGFGGGWVTTASYSESSTQLDLKPGANGAETSLHAQAYGIAVAKHGLFGNDALGVALSRPAPSYDTGSFTSGNSNDLQFFGHDKLFAGAAPETDIELGYVTSFLDGGSIALQTNASYQMNFGGQNGNNAMTVLSRAKIKF